MKKVLLSCVAIFSAAIAANAQAYIPNPGFESWGNTAGEDQQPQGWISYNVFTSPLVPGGNSNPTSVTQAGTPDNYQGNYSARIETVTLVANPDTTAIPWTAGPMFTGSIALTSPYMFPGYGSQQRPQSLSYYAKYTPANGDSAICVVAVTHWNGSGRDTVAVGFDFMNTAVSSYTQRNVTLAYDPGFATTIPDTISIMFSSSSFWAPQVGSVLYVDALAFTGYVGIEETSDENGVSVYPNPSSTLTHFDVTVDNAKNVVVYDMMGREVRTQNFSGKAAILNTADLANGVYTYAIFTQDGEALTRGQFSVGH